MLAIEDQEMCPSDGDRSMTRRLAALRRGTLYLLRQFLSLLTLFLWIPKFESKVLDVVFYLLTETIKGCASCFNYVRRGYRILQPSRKYQVKAVAFLQ